MRRREFMGLVGGAAITWPVAARAQQQMPVIGWLFGVSAQAGQPPLTAFRKALGAEGFVEGQNVQIEYRWADSQYDKLPAMAADLVAKSVTVIVAGGGDPSGHAAKAATSTIPIVIVTGSDPVKEGLSPISIDQAATSPARRFWPMKWNPSASACCTRQCRPPRPSPFC